MMGAFKIGKDWVEDGDAEFSEEQGREATDDENDEKEGDIYEVEFDEENDG